MWIETLAVGSREIGNCPFDFRHPSAAAPTGGEMRPNLSGATGRQFAVGDQK
ncbi:MAG: hypothetical protein ABSD96_06415 [Candidatus Korobacteraceae bacterium]